MKGKIIDKNVTEAFISMESGQTLDVSLARLPKNVKVGDTVDIPFNSGNHTLMNDKLVDFF